MKALYDDSQISDSDRFWSFASRYYDLLGDNLQLRTVILTSALCATLPP